MGDAKTSKVISGQCLCGAVKIRAQIAEPVLRACHCEMCRRHTSAAFLSVQTVPGSVEVSGPATSFASSEWAERGFCATCGSTLWYGTVHDGARNLAAGLFEDAAGAVLVQEYFADQCPHGYAFAGTHERLSREETIALFTGGDA